MVGVLCMLLQVLHLGRLVLRVMLPVLRVGAGREGLRLLPVRVRGRVVHGWAQAACESICHSPQTKGLSLNHLSPCRTILFECTGIPHIHLPQHQLVDPSPR